jgi:beta-glucosidase
MHFVIKICVLFSIISFLSFRHWRYERGKNKIIERINQLKNNLKPDFPENFMFGVATSSYQTEGNNINSNFTQWEIKNSLEPTGKACNSWEKFDEDLDALRFIKADSYRFSIEWSRIEPSMNNYQIDIIKEYRRRILLLRKYNIEPIVTLIHFSLPNWVSKKGGYLNPNFSNYYSKYVDLVHSYLYSDVTYWVTFNEAMLDLIHSYILGRRPPQQKWKYSNFNIAIKTIANSHIQVYHIIKKRRNNSEIGISENVFLVKPKHYWNPFNYLFVYLIHYYANNVLLDKIHNYLTFIGVNHYNIGYISFSPFGLKLDLIGDSKKVTDMEWGFNAFSLFDAIDYIYNKYQKKIIVTEHGVAERGNNDQLRVHCLQSSIACIESAIKNQIPVIGYNYWSLMDNVEWEFGKGKRFGLFYTDYLESDIGNDRLIKKYSASYFRKIQINRKKFIYK